MSTKKKRGRRSNRSRAEWRRLIGQWRRSGMSGRQFAAEHDLGLQSFYAWKTAFESEETPEVRFVPVELDDARTSFGRVATDRPLAVLEVGKCRLMVGAETDPRWLAALVRELAEC